MAIADRTGLPIAIYVSSATPHELTLVERTLESCFTTHEPERLIGDKAYDSDPLDAQLRTNGIELIAPHRSNRRKAKTQDGRPLRRYKRRWRIERLNAWLQNARRVVIRYEHDVRNYTGFVHLACLRILLKRYCQVFLR
jgi:transposase